jgi:hypothetical protein
MFVVEWLVALLGVFEVVRETNRRCTDLTDDQLWRAIAQNTEKLAALIYQQLELDDADPASIHPRVKADLIIFASKCQGQYRQYADELRRRYPLSC